MRILVIEDNQDLCDSMCYHLKNSGYNADSCYTGEDALFYALSGNYDIIVLDRMLPVMDGLSILKKIREKGITIPVILVTAMDGLHDRINGLDSGADDYLVKPFAIEELLARIRALARRPQNLEQSHLLTFSNLTLDPINQTITTPEGNRSLSKRENDLLEFFLRKPGQVLNREILLSHVWGPDNFVEDGNLDNYIHFLRRHLRSVSANVQLKTIHSVGYRLETMEEERNS